MPEILSLEQYLKELKNSGAHKFRPKCCPHCQRHGLRAHGHYNRKADRQLYPHEHSNLNPIPILRFYCPHCRRTCSVLPECIAPRRWYSWKEQEHCLVASFHESSVQKIAKKFLPSRQTINRWLHWVVDRFKEFRPDLQSRFPFLGYESEALNWWKKLLKKMRLSATMVILNKMGISVP